MRILILTQYYLPETGAPQNRLSSLAFYLKEFGNEVEILTANPNYPRNEIYPGYQAWKNCTEVINEIKVYFKDKVYQTIIPRNIRLSEAPSFGKPINYYDASSVGAARYKELAEELLGIYKVLNKVNENAPQGEYQNGQ